MLQFYSHFIITRTTKPVEKRRLLALDTASYEQYNEKERRLFNRSSNEHEIHYPHSFSVRHKSVDFFFPPKLALSGNTIAVLALAIVWPLLVMLLQLILCKAS